MSWIEKFIKWFYKDKVTKIRYTFSKDEVINILHQYLLNGRNNIINLEDYKIISSVYHIDATTQYVDFELKPIEDIPPPPPKDKEEDKIPPENTENKNTNDNVSDIIPHRANNS